MKQRLFEEFNTLSIIYEKPADQFIEPKYRESKIAGDYDDVESPLGLNAPASPNTTQDLSATLELNPEANDVMGDLLDLGDSNGTTTVNDSDRWTLVPGAVMDQATFQNRWESLPQATFMDLFLNRLPTVDELETAAKEENIVCMASGDLGSEFKFYFFGQDSKNAFYFCEVSLKKDDKHFTASIKAEEESHADEFANAFTSTITRFLV
mmetsp:Transcript_15688/g.20647  ORF Transcript_15688/g.20647 Transcript_15688/m.20647 type:complete len:209 (+) Transcript_15688:61-687(+)